MYGQYNPYMGATPQMQQRLNYLQQQQQQAYQQYIFERCKNGVRGRRYAQTKEILGEGKR